VRASTVDVELYDAADESVKSGTSGELGDSVNNGVNFLEISTGTSVASGANDGRFPPNVLRCCAALCPFWKVLRIVGDVAESVSSRRLVEAFPKSEELSCVSRVSFGRL